MINLYFKDRHQNKYNLVKFVSLCSAVLFINTACAEDQAVKETDKIVELETQDDHKKVNLKNIYASTLQTQGNCVAKAENEFECNGDSHYEFTLIKMTDLNGDGIKDVLAKSVESMPGFNYAVSNLNMLILDSNNQLVDSHSLLMYAHGAHNTFDILKISEDSQSLNSQLADGAYISINTKLNNDDEIGNAETNHVSQTILFKDDLPYEQSYLTQCQLAKMMDKRIFKNELDISTSVEVNRKTTIDSTDYTQLQEETMMTESGDVYRAKIYGCDNLKLTFSVSGNSVTIQSALESLERFTRFSSVFKEQAVQEYKMSVNPESDVWLYTTTGWKINILHSTTDETVTIHLTNVDNQEEQGSHWNRVLRLKDE